MNTTSTGQDNGARSNIQNWRRRARVAGALAALGLAATTAVTSAAPARADFTQNRITSCSDNYVSTITTIVPKQRVVNNGQYVSLAFKVQSVTGPLYISNWSSSQFIPATGKTFINNAPARAAGIWGRANVWVGAAYHNGKAWVFDATWTYIGPCTVTGDYIIAR